MKPFLILAVLFICMNIACAQQSMQDTLLPLQATLTMNKDVYRTGEPWQYEIRIENTGIDTLRILVSVDKHYLPKMYSSNGDLICYDYAVAVMMNLRTEKTFELIPGCFYGTTTTWPGNMPADTYSFHVEYYNPINTGDPLPYYKFGKVISNTVTVVVQ
jgi:hypothetical protein